MSVNQPPYPNVDRFNNLYWDTTPTTLTQQEADLKYLKFPTSQSAVETFIGRPVMTTGLDSNGQININNTAATTITTANGSDVTLSFDDGTPNISDTTIGYKVFNYIPSGTATALYQFQYNSAEVFRINSTALRVAKNLTLASNVILQTTQPTNTDGYLGYTNKVNANVTATLTTGVFANMTSGAGLGVIQPGVYIFSINIFNTKSAATGDITNIQVGISTSATAQVGGFQAYVMGHQTYTTSSTDQIVGVISYTFSVPTATNYYLNQFSTFTGAMSLTTTTISWCQYTRIA